MSVKLADTLAPMGDFEVAEAKDVSVDIDGNKKSLQKAVDDGDIGGGNQIQFDILPIASAELLGKVYQFIGDTGTYSKGSFYECIEKDGSYLWDKLSADTPVTLTEAQWEALDKSTLKDGQQINIKDDSEASIINDDKTTVDNTWSAKKISDSLVDLEKDVAHKVSLEYNSITDADNAPDGFSDGYNSTHAPSQGMWYKYVTFSIDGNDSYRVQEAHSLSTNKIYIRRKEGGEGWSAWQELATMDKVARFPDYSRRITMTANSWVATEDVYVTFFRIDSGKLPSADGIKINNVGVGVSDFDGSGSDNVGAVTFNGYVKKGSTIESIVLTNVSSCKIYPLI